MTSKLLTLFAPTRPDHLPNLALWLDAGLGAKEGLRDAFTRVDAGPTQAWGTAESGETWLATGDGYQQALIVSNRAGMSNDDYTLYSYLQKTGAQKLGGKISWHSGGGGTGSSAMAIISSPESALLNNMVHVSITRTQTLLQLREAAGSFETKATANYSALADDGTQYDVAIWREGSTVYCLAPDGTTLSATDSRVPSLWGDYLVWEIFQTAAVESTGRWDDAYSHAVATNNTKVQEHKERSTNAFTFLQNTVASMPTYVTGAQNGKPTLRFDGTADRLKVSSYPAALNTSEGSVFLLFKASIVTGDRNMLVSADETLNSRYLLFGLGVSTNFRLKLGWSNAGTATSILGSSTIAVNTWYLAEFHSNSSAYEIILNGVAETLTVASGTNNGNWFADTTAHDNLVVGALDYNGGTVIQFFAGDLPEPLVYARNLTEPERKQVRRYLKNKYGLTAVTV